MPRNRKRKPPTEPIEARIDADEAVRCARCGQRFPFGFVPAGFLDYLSDKDDILVQSASPREGVGHVIEARVLGGGRVMVQLGPPGTMAIRPYDAAVRVISEAAWGWRFDGETWRPTSEMRARWAQARRVVRRPEHYTQQQFEKAQAGLARGSFPRKDPDRIVKHSMFAPDPANETVQRFTLPTNIECVDCDVVNCVAEEF